MKAAANLLYRSASKVCLGPIYTPFYPAYNFSQVTRFGFEDLADFHIFSEFDRNKSLYIKYVHF